MSASTATGIDPGNVQTAIVVILEKEIVYKAILPNNEAFNWLHTTWRTKYFSPVLMEKMVCMGMPAGKTMWDTAMWIGRFIEALRCSPLALVSRMEIKMHFCGTTRAKDGNIRQALLDRYGPQGTKKEPGATYQVAKDMWSALAIAAYMQDHTVGPEGSGGQFYTMTANAKVDVIDWGSSGTPYLTTL